MQECAARYVCVCVCVCVRARACIHRQHTHTHTHAHTHTYRDMIHTYISGISASGMKPTCAQHVPHAFLVRPEPPLLGRAHSQLSLSLSLPISLLLQVGRCRLRDVNIRYISARTYNSHRRARTHTRTHTRICISNAYIQARARKHFVNAPSPPSQRVFTQGCVGKMGSLTLRRAARRRRARSCRLECSASTLPGVSGEERRRRGGTVGHGRGRRVANYANYLRQLLDLLEDGLVPALGVATPFKPAYCRQRRVIPVADRSPFCGRTRHMC